MFRAHALVAALALLGMAHAQPPQEKSPADLIADFEARILRGDAIIAEIGAMHARDQYLREVIIETFKTIKSEAVRQEFIDGTAHVFSRIDGENTRQLLALLDTIGWDGLTAMSPQAAKDAWSIVSHSPDLNFKKRMLALFEPLALTGKADGQQYANLFDDVAQAEGNLQRYGTNFDCLDGRQQPRPTENMAGLNARRAALGMMPIEEYARIIEEMYGACPAN